MCRPRSLLAPEWQVEGGAEVFARSFDKKIMRMFGAYPDVWAYDGYAARVRKQAPDFPEVDADAAATACRPIVDQR
jgi:hypothetical protein